MSRNVILEEPIDLGRGGEAITEEIVADFVKDLGTGEAIPKVITYVGKIETILIEKGDQKYVTATELKDRVQYVRDSNIIKVKQIKKKNFWYLTLLCLSNIILMITTIIYSFKTYETKAIKQNVYKIFLWLDILFILLNILFTLFSLRKICNPDDNDKNSMNKNNQKILIYLILSILLTSTTLYIIICTLNYKWVNKGIDNSLLTICIIILSIVEIWVPLALDDAVTKRTNTS